jgi:hypothetical protein
MIDLDFGAVADLRANNYLNCAQKVELYDSHAKSHVLS